jgi:hypothetical protein
VSVVRMRPPPAENLRAVLLDAADRALRRDGYSHTFRQAVKTRILRVLESELPSGYVDFSSWPEYQSLDPGTIAAISPFIRRLASAAAQSALESLCVLYLIPEVISVIEARTLIEPGAPAPRDPPRAA